MAALEEPPPKQDLLNRMNAFLDAYGGVTFDIDKWRAEKVTEGLNAPLINYENLKKERSRDALSDNCSSYSETASSCEDGELSVESPEPANALKRKAPPTPPPPPLGEDDTFEGTDPNGAKKMRKHNENGEEQSGREMKSLTSKQRRKLENKRAKQMVESVGLAMGAKDYYLPLDEYIQRQKLLFKAARKGADEAAIASIYSSFPGRLKTPQANASSSSSSFQPNSDPLSSSQPLQSSYSIPPPPAPTTNTDTNFAKITSPSQQNKNSAHPSKHVRQQQTLSNDLSLQQKQEKPRRKRKRNKKNHDSQVRSQPAGQEQPKTGSSAKFPLPQQEQQQLKSKHSPSPPSGQQQQKIDEQGGPSQQPKPTTSLPTTSPSPSRLVPPSSSIHYSSNQPYQPSLHQMLSSNPAFLQQLIPFPPFVTSFPPMPNPVLSSVPQGQPMLNPNMAPQMGGQSQVNPYFGVPMYAPQGYWNYG